MLPLVIFFFIDARFLFFWFCERNINITLEVWQYFLRGKLKCDFSWKTERRRKKAVLYISKFTIKKSYEASQRLPLTALSARYLNFFVIVPRDWWDSSICLSYGLVLFLYVLLFLILRIFSMFFFSSILQLFIFKFPLLRKCCFIN